MEDVNYFRALRDVREGKSSAEEAINTHDVHPDDHADLRAAETGQLPVDGWPRVSPENLAAALTAVRPGISMQEVTDRYGILSRTDRKALKARFVEVSPLEAQIEAQMPKANTVRTHQDAVEYWKQYAPVTTERASSLFERLKMANLEGRLNSDSYLRLVGVGTNEVGS